MNYLSVGHITSGFSHSPPAWPPFPCRPKAPWGRDLPWLGVHTVLAKVLLLHSSIAQIINQMCWLYSSLSIAKKFTKVDGSFYMAVPDIKVWPSVCWFHGNTELNCIYVGKPMPRELSHSAQSSSYGSLNICFSKVQPSSSTKASSMLLAADVYFSYIALRQKQRHLDFQAITLVTREERESPVSGTNPEDRPGLCLELRTTNTKKQGCRIIINLYSYFHTLTLNLFIPVSISTGFSVSLFAQREMLLTACVKSERAGFGHLEINCCSHQSHIKVLKGK